ncbi:MAG TPA: hypothetical protein VKA61_12115 [Sphingomicrobium sp.]|nr:hypothetical protein [Sphingomicrobium sp.]
MTTTDLTPHRARIRRGLDAGETYEELMAAVKWPGTKPRAFRAAIVRQLGIKPDLRPRAHAGTSTLSLQPREFREADRLAGAEAKSGRIDPKGANNG